MTTIGIIGILIALALFMILVYKGISTFIVAPVCAVIVAVTNSIGPTDAFYTFASGMGEMIVTLFANVFLGIILGKCYDKTKACASIAKTLTDKFVTRKDNYNYQIRVACLIMLIIGGAMTLGGIDGFVLTFTTFPIAFILCEMVNIPRRFIPAMLMLNCSFMAFPGAPQVDNTVMVATLVGEGYDVTSTAGLIPGIIGCVVVMILGYCTLTTMIIKAHNKGEIFESAGIESADVFSEENKLPNFFVALIPLVLVYVLYSIVKLDIAAALTIGIIATLVLMGRYIDRKEVNLGKAIVNVLNLGADGYPHAIATVSTPSGLAAVVTSTAAFGVIVGALASLNLPPIWLGLLTTCVIVAITSAPPVALAVGLPIITGILASKGMDFNVAGLGRVCSLATTTFETLPVNGMCVLTIGLSKSTYKDSYPVMFLNSLVYTLIGAIVAAIILSIAPGLA